VRFTGIGCLLLAACTAEVCDQDIQQTIASPSGARSAVVFVRECESPRGTVATTDVSVLPTGRELPDEPGNAYVRYGRAELAVRWEGENVLRVADPQSGVTRQITLPTSSATSSAPRLSKATPTGRPQASSCGERNPVRRSTGLPDGRPFSKGISTTL